MTVLWCVRLVYPDIFIFSYMVSLHELAHHNEGWSNSAACNVVMEILNAQTYWDLFNKYLNTLVARIIKQSRKRILIKLNRSDSWWKPFWLQWGFNNYNSNICNNLARLEDKVRRCINCFSIRHNFISYPYWFMECLNKGYLHDISGTHILPESQLALPQNNCSALHGKLRITHATFYLFSQASRNNN